MSLGTTRHQPDSLTFHNDSVDSCVRGNRSTALTGAGTEQSMFLVLAIVAVGYAFLANLRTVADSDFFWQLAAGRWVAQHQRIFSSDVFSYTTQGQPWIYPAGSGLIFYATYFIGGFALISWIGAIACAGTIALLVRRGSIAVAAVAILAVPLIANRTVPRAEMFTVVLFAAFLSILWQNRCDNHAPLWLLPVTAAEVSVADEARSVLHRVR